MKKYKVIAPKSTNIKQVHLNFPAKTIDFIDGVAIVELHSNHVKHPTEHDYFAEEINN